MSYNEDISDDDYDYKIKYTSELDQGVLMSLPRATDSKYDIHIYFIRIVEQYASLNLDVLDQILSSLVEKGLARKWRPHDIEYVLTDEGCVVVDKLLAERREKYKYYKAMTSAGIFFCKENETRFRHFIENTNWEVEK